MNADERECEAGETEHGEEAVCVTVTMTRGQHRALKRAARDAGTGVSAIIREWVRREGGAPGTDAISKDPSTDGRGRGGG
ncbi:MAG: hypothetical protein IKF78_08840 [Atopobiaceae bacterium]|nr:hypothetical protein [Atopobiaceae bacterium]